MLEKIPTVEAERIEKEMRKEEKKDLAEMKKNIWRKWRGKSGILERKTKIPKEIELVERRLKEITEKIKINYCEHFQNSKCF